MPARTRRVVCTGNRRKKARAMRDAAPRGPTGTATRAAGTRAITARDEPFILPGTAQEVAAGITWLLSEWTGRYFAGSGCSRKNAHIWLLASMLLLVGPTNHSARGLPPGQVWPPPWTV